MKVLFVQLFARQFHPIQSAYDGPLELDYLDSAQDESIERLKAKAASADKVVLITKFISHKHSDVVPRDKVEYLDSVNIVRALAVLKKI
jgi:hypothetical protein